MRILRVSKTFSQLRVLIVTMISSIGSLFWSMVLLMILMYTFAVFLSQSLQYDLSELLASPGNEEMKLFLHNNYGTATKATWTMFEITFSGGWPTWVSPVVAEVSTAYTFIFALYVTVVVFAVTRIITALFLKDTLARAAEDTEMMLRETARKKASCVKQLREMFNSADKSGDGYITQDEFRQLLSHPEVKAHCAVLELPVWEIEQLYALIDDGDGLVSYEEFCKGVMRIKGPARSLDVITVLHNIRAILEVCCHMANDMSICRRQDGAAARGGEDEVSNALLARLDAQ